MTLQLFSRNQCFAWKYQTRLVKRFSRTHVPAVCGSWALSFCLGVILLSVQHLSWRKLTAKVGFMLPWLLPAEWEHGWLSWRVFFFLQRSAFKPFHPSVYCHESSVEVKIIIIIKKQSFIVGMYPAVFLLMLLQRKFSKFSGLSPLVNFVMFISIFPNLSSVFVLYFWFSVMLLRFLSA